MPQLQFMISLTQRCGPFFWERIEYHLLSLSHSGTYTKWPPHSGERCGFSNWGFGDAFGLVRSSSHGVIPEACLQTSCWRPKATAWSMFLSWTLIFLSAFSPFFFTLWWRNLLRTLGAARHKQVSPLEAPKTRLAGQPHTFSTSPTEEVDSLTSAENVSAAAAG